MAVGVRKVEVPDIKKGANIESKFIATIQPGQRY